MKIKFNERDVFKANAEWGCNCGPSALAAVLGLTLDEVRPIVEKVGFAQRGYMNISMMRECVADRMLFARPCNPETDLATVLPFDGLVRIQWGGPWIINGKPARWAATATHWIAASSSAIVFDVNGGRMLYDQWRTEIVPLIVASIKRADGRWWPTHCWEIAT